MGTKLMPIKDFDPDKIETRNPKWEFTIQVKTGQVSVMTEDGEIWLQKIVYTDRGEGAKVEVSGRLIGRPNYTPTMRSRNFNVNGHPQWQLCPQIVLDIIAHHGFGRKSLADES